MSRTCDPKGMKPFSSNPPDTENLELLEVVDEKNRPLGLATRREIHEKGLRHRSVHVFLFNSRGQLFLQRRSGSKDQYPDHWDTSAAGHTAPGESPMEAACRELKEELGLEMDLTWVLAYPACEETGWEFVTLFAGLSDQPVSLNREEASEGGYFSPQQIRGLLEDPRQKVAPGFRLLYSLFQKQSHPLSSA